MFVDRERELEALESRYRSDRAELVVVTGYSHERILKAYPYLEPEDLREALAYAMWRVEEIEAPLARTT